MVSSVLRRSEPPDLSRLSAVNSVPEGLGCPAKGEQSDLENGPSLRAGKWRPFPLRTGGNNRGCMFVAKLAEVREPAALIGPEKRRLGLQQGPEFQGRRLAAFEDHLL